MATYSIIKNASQTAGLPQYVFDTTPPNMNASRSANRDDKVDANPATSIVSKRVRFGSDSSDELTVQVREFELEAPETDSSPTRTQSPTQELHVANSATSSSANEDILSSATDMNQSAPSSTSTAASSKYSFGGSGVTTPMQTPGSNKADLQYYLGSNAHLPQVLPPPPIGGRRITRLATSLAQSMPEDPAPPSDEFDLPMDHYMWADDTSSNPTFVYEEVPPLPPPRHRYEPRSRPVYRRRPQYDDSPADGAQPANPESAFAYNSSFKLQPPAALRSTTTSYQHGREDYWREEPLPQGVPLILGPHGQWRVYTPAERSVVFDSQRGGWISRSAAMMCECGTGRTCPQHRRRGTPSPAPASTGGQADWSEDEYELEQQTYLPPTRTKARPEQLMRRLYMGVPGGRQGGSSAFSANTDLKNRYDASISSGGWDVYRY